jgi:CRISPR-associated protein Cas1
MAEIRQNILYVTIQGLYLHHELEVLKVKQGPDTLLKIPLHHLQGITIFGVSTISPSLLRKCLEADVFVSYLSERGRFLGRLEGSRSGNVLLRIAQIKRALNEAETLDIARAFVAGKIQNSRSNVLRSARDSDQEEHAEELRRVAEKLRASVAKIPRAESLEQLRGFEGDSAKAYFSVFDHCIRQQKEMFQFTKRMRRPPRSRINALLSFVYALLTNECIAACQAVGLDPYVGYLHDERPGRPSLALDLVEEFRSYGDRLVLTMINRLQIQPADIIERTGGTYQLTDDARKEFLKAYQERKQEEIQHPVLDTRCRIGELPFLQARLLARRIRGDLESYPPYLWK